MKKIAFLTALILAGTANAQLATFDATTAANVVKQVEATTELIGTAEQQLKEIESFNTNITGNLGRSNELSSKLNEIRRKYNKVSRSISRIKLGDGSVPDFGDINDIKQTLDYIYDPTPINRVDKQRMQYIHRQTTKKSALEEAEHTIGNIESNLMDIDSLVKEADATETLKDSQDMTNKLLMALISNQVEIKHLLAQLTRVQAAQGYEGIQTDESYHLENESISDTIGTGAVTKWGDGEAPCPDMLSQLNQC